jgi:photosystem II stability/assembly factor-like uncharacterized protein
MKRLLLGVLFAVPMVWAAQMGCQPVPPSNNNVDMNSSMPDLAQGALKILSLGTNVTSLTEGGSVRFTAVVTHTDGLAKLLGGQLQSPDGKIKFGAFVAGAGGAYSLDLTWAQIHQAQAISFDQQQTRSFTAEFYDVDGNKVTGNIDLTLSCGGDPACAGKCQKAGTLCAGSTSLICVAGACKDGCYIGGAFQAANATNADPDYGTCQKCDTAMSRSAWTNATAGTTCGANLACVTGGQCSKLFTKATVSTSSAFYDVWGTSATDVWAVGDANTAFRSTDNGKTWTATAIYAGAAATRYAIWGPSSANVFVVGGSGTVVTTTNSGTNWSTVPTPAAVTLYGMWGTSLNDMYVVGASGTIAHSTNGGASWTSQTSGTTNTLRGVWGSGASNVYAVGYAGTLLRSTDSGATWVAAQTNVTTDLYAVRGVAANDYYAVGSSGTVLRSTDGANWTKLSFPDTSYTIYDVWGDATNSVYVSTGITVYFTKNSGQTWQRMSISSLPYYYGIWGTSPTDIYAVGSSSSIYHHP